MGNILQSGASLGLMGATIKGTYADGTNVSGHLDYSFPSGSSLTLSAERYAYTLFRTKEKQITRHGQHHAADDPRSPVVCVRRVRPGVGE